MIILKRKYFIYFLLLAFTFGFTNCASKKNTTTPIIVATENKTNDKISEKNILYLVEGKEVSSEYIKKLSTTKIKSITVIKGKEDIKKYTNKKYDGVVIIELKKLL